MEVTSLDTQLLAGAAPGPSDSQVLDALSRAAAKQSSARRTWHVAVRNAGGAIYRTVALDDLEQFACFDAEMYKLGFVDELPEEVDQVDGYDAIYRA